MQSIWHKTVELKKRPKLEKDLKTDVLIIGGGLTGLLCAYALTRAGVDCAVVEADRIMGGVSGNTTAKITYHHSLIYSKLDKLYGEKAAGLYLEANARALQRYRVMCKDIDCDFETVDSYVYTRGDRQKLIAEQKVLHAVGCAADITDDVTLPFAVSGALRIKDQAQFNPLKFADALSEDINIYENTKVTELSERGARTKHAEITAKNIIIATHFPILNKHGGYFLKLYQHRSYVSVLADAPKMNGMYVDGEGGLSFRNYGELLLVGGGSHRTGKQGGGWNEIEYVARRAYPDSRVVARFATQDCMSLDGIPYIGRYSKNTQALYVATGFNKWGMTSAMAAADVLCDMIRGKNNRFAPLFSPSRTMYAKQLLLNAASSLVGLITPTVPRCPHLGCALKYNADEHTWDCPCHGSRFTASGKLIEGPATDDKKM